MLGPAPPPPRRCSSSNDITSDTFRLKKSVKASIRHANDSRAFLKLLKRTQKGSALDKILEFTKSINHDLTEYTDLLDELTGKTERAKNISEVDKGLEDFGASNNTEHEFFVNINKASLDNNPLL